LKYFSIAVVVYLVEYFGVFIHIFELDYDLFFRYPLESDVQFSSQRNDILPINNYSFTIIHNPEIKCHGKRKPYLTFMIKSAIGHADRRYAIRRTWGFEHRFSDVHVRCIFVLGTSTHGEHMTMINKEAESNNDILQGNFIDDYYNNTLKMVLSMQWASKFCGNSTFFMFVDDDYYVSVKNVLRFITSPSIYPKFIQKPKLIHESNTTAKTFNKKLFAGFVFQTAPHRHKFSKWFVSLQEYPFNIWPPYITAGAFIISREALKEMYYVSLYTRHFRFDDVFLGIVAMKANILLTHCDMFHFDRPIYSGPESFRNIIASHGFENVDMEIIWNECRSAGFA